MLVFQNCANILFILSKIIYVQIISEILGLMAALISSWVVWLQQFQLWKNCKRSMIHDVKWKGRVNSYFWLFAGFQISPGILGWRIQYSRFTVLMLRCLGSVILLQSQFWIASFIKDSKVKILPLTSEIRVKWNLSEDITTILILFLT